MTLDVDALTHRYGRELAVDDVSLSVSEGELVCLLGPSGCGKTTIVQAIAGHLRPTAGRIRLRGRDVTDDPPEDRRVGVVFQESTLYPHMTVEENVAYGLEGRGVAPDRRASIVDEHLDLVDLTAKRDARPAELSGGQRRRVELARALAPEPDVLLLDEPLSALDRSLRVHLRDEIARIQRETDVTTLFVTHDQEEAMALADRLVVMNDGAIAGVGTPRELYDTPPTPFVASFLGRSSQITASIASTDPPTLRIGDATLTTTPPRSAEEGKAVVCHVRPENLRIEPDVADGARGEGVDAVLEGTVRRVTDVGRRYDVTVDLDGGDEVVVECDTEPPDSGGRITVGIDASDVTVFAGESTPP